MKIRFLRIINTWIIKPFTKFMNTGLSPDKLALSFALGSCLGIMPFPGSTLVCALAAIVLGLNFGAIQLINYMVAPVQLVLIYPFLKAGAFLLNSNVMNGTFEVFKERFGLHLWQTLYELGLSALVAVIIWMLISIPVGIILYKITLPVFRKVTAKRFSEKTTDNQPKIPFT